MSWLPEIKTSNLLQKCHLKNQYRTILHKQNPYLSGTGKESVAQPREIDFKFEDAVNIWKFKINGVGSGFLVQRQREPNKRIDAHKFQLDIITPERFPFPFRSSLLDDNAVVLWKKWLIVNLLLFSMQWQTS